MSFLSFMRSPSGRGLRTVAGAALITVGVATGGAGGVVTTIVGVVPLTAGVFNFCLAGPLFGVDLMGRKARGADPVGKPLTSLSRPRRLQSDRDQPE